MISIKAATRADPITIAVEFQTKPGQEECAKEIVNGREAAAMWIGKGKTQEGQDVIFKGIDLFEFDQEGKIILLRGFWTPPE